MRTTRRRKGNSLVEFALVAPVLTLVMLSLLQFGFYNYALISVQNAARVAALRNSFGEESAANQSAACIAATEELRGILGLTSETVPAGCSSAPLVVESRFCDQSVTCDGTATSADGGAAVYVRVRFTMPDWLPLRGGDVISRSSQMRIRNFQ